MNNILQNIDSAKYIMIVSDKETLAGASAFYTHILRLHKKVALVCEDESIDSNLSFLPWFDKIKAKKLSSCDFEVKFDYSCMELYDYFINNGIKINPKMATALYAGLLQESDGFLSASVDEKTFSMAKELVECRADCKACNTNIMKSTSLSKLRLKANMLANMLLVSDAKIAIFEIKDDDLKSTGSSIKDCDETLKEALKLPHIEYVILLHIDAEYELLKIINKEI